MSGKTKPHQSFENDPLFLEVMAEALAIQDRFSAEPIYAKTGKGHLKSVGIEEIAETKKLSERSSAPRSHRPRWGSCP
jgi:hypothetical protein